MTRISLTLVLFSAAVAHAGSLTPPPGPIAPTMRSLAEVEPRRPLTMTFGELDAVWVISQPGSYYLTGPVIGEVGKHGIKIAAEHVTLDLNGFTLFGIPGSLSGITVLPNRDAGIPDTRYNVRVFNGIVQQWGQHGVDLRAIVGGSIENIQSTENTGDGIRVGYGMTVRNCFVRGNAVGITSDFGATSIIDCVALLNRGNGIRSFVNSTIERCSSRFNQGNGIEGGFGCVIRSSTTSNNTLYGIYAFNACNVLDCVSGSDTVAGIGIQFDSLARGNICSLSSSGVGIFCIDRRNRIEGNHVSSNRIGIQVVGSNNIVVRNTATANSQGDFSIALGNTFGPIVNASAGGDLSTISGGNHPAANIRH